MTWSYLSTFVHAGLSLVVLSLLARLLTPEDFGLIGLVLIFADFAKQISVMGVGQAVIQVKNLTGKHIRVGFTFLFIMGISMFALLWFTAPVIENYFNWQNLKSVLRVMGLSIIIGNFAGISDSMLRRKLLFKEIMICNTVSYVIGYGIVGITLALMKKGVWSLVFAVLVTRFVFAVMIFFMSPHSLKPLLGKKEFSQLITLGGGFILGNTFNLVARQADSFIVGKLLGMNAYGIYNRAYHLTNLPINYFSEALARVLFPAMADIQEEKERLKKVYTRGVELISSIGLPVSIFLFIAAPEIVGAILGDQWDRAVPILQILSLGIIFKIGNSLSNALNRAAGAVYRSAWRLFIYMILVIAGAAAGAAWGLPGVAVGILIAVLVNYTLLLHLSMKLVGMTFIEFIKCYLPSVRLSLFLVLIVFPCLYLLRHFNLPDWPRFLGALAVGGFSLLLPLFLLPKKMLGTALQWIFNEFNVKLPWPFNRLKNKFK